MLKKRNIVFMLILFTTTCFLGGCSLLNIARTNTPSQTPDQQPVISTPATPTPTDSHGNNQDASTVTGAADPTDTKPPIPTATSIPTATPSPSPTPSPVPAVPEAPTTLNIDTTTYTFLINRDYPLTSAYLPDDLVIPDIKFSFQDLTEDKSKLRKVAADALTELCAAALAEEDLTIYGVSGYRSYDRQYDIYGSNIIKKGIRHTNLYSAAPGNSEHQTGLAIDVSCQEVGFSLVERFAETAEGIWLKENCWRFGFILRYPKDKEHITGYAYEPWHIRYVGIPLAYYLYTNHLTLEEYYGSPSSHTLAELEDKPLIDLTTTRYYKLYAKTKGSEPYYLSDGSIWVSDVTGLPYLKEVIRDKDGNTVRVNGRAFFLEPIRDEHGNYVLDNNAEICYAKPYFDDEGNLWLDYNGNPVYLQPLWKANGALARDKRGNILYTEPLTDCFGLEVMDENGSLTMKVPVRDKNGELTYDSKGNALFYEPFSNPITGEFILDSATGLPLYPSDYYQVPHNTYPIPKGYIPPEPELPEEPEEPQEPEEPDEPEEPQEPEEPDNSEISDDDWWQIYYEEWLKELENQENPDYNNEAPDDTTEETGGFPE